MSMGMVRSEWSGLRQKEKSLEYKPYSRPTEPRKRKAESITKGVVYMF